MLKSKKWILIGERDGIPGPILEEVARSAGAEVALTVTECFV
jgi:glycine reductase